MSNKFINLCKAESVYKLIPDFTLYNFSPNDEKEMETFLNKNKKVCLRSCPNYSLPGCFDSYFNLTTLEEVSEKEKLMKEILKSFKVQMISKRMGIVDLDLLMIIQKQIEGISGVAFSHSLEGFKELRYEVSDKQGFITDGKNSFVELNDTQKEKLKNLITILFKKFKEPIEIEFVFEKDILWLLQVRTLSLNVEKIKNLFSSMSFKEIQNYTSNIYKFVKPIEKDKKPSNAIKVLKGIPKVLGCVKGILNEDILFLEDLECGQEHLLENVKCILTSASNNFCHLISLCSKLQIPILTSIDEKALKGLKEIFVDCYEGLVYKI